MGVIRKILEVFGLVVIIPLLVAFYLSASTPGLALSTRNLVVLITSFIAVLGVIAFLKLGRILTQLHNSLQMMAKGGMVYQQVIKKSSGAAELANSINEVSQRLRESMDELESRAILIERANQELKRINELKSMYISDVVHELRAPLINIDKSSAIMLGKEVNITDTEEDNFLRIINDNAKRLTRLINNLLDVSRMESGQMLIKHELFSVKEAIEEAIKSVDAWRQNKMLTLETKISDDINNVYADRDRIIQVIVNLLSNAIKFSYPKGKILVEAGVFKGNIDANPSLSGIHRFIEIAVQDKGIGIPESQKEVLFDRFKRLSDSPVKSLPSAGLGLPIAKQIIEMHNGKIWFVSYAEKGSRFTFVIPQRLDNKLSSLKPSVQNLGRKILIIDDEENTRELLSRELNKKGHAVATAKDGLEGLKKAVEYYYDLIITDVRMPKIDGTDCIKILKMINPKLCFIIITGFSVEEDLEKIIKRDACPCVTKPFDLQELLRLVEGLPFVPAHN